MHLGIFPEQEENVAFFFSVLSYLFLSWVLEFVPRKWVFRTTCFRLSYKHPSQRDRGEWQLAHVPLGSQRPTEHIHLCLSVVYFFFFVKSCCYYYYPLLPLFLTLFSLLLSHSFTYSANTHLSITHYVIRVVGKINIPPSSPQPIRKDGLIFTIPLTYKEQSTVSIHFRVNRGNGNSGVSKQDVLVACLLFITSELRMTSLYGGDGRGTVGNVVLSLFQGQQALISMVPSL